MSTIDNIMAISAIIERNRTLKTNTYLFIADARKCFDKLWLKDCLLQLKRREFPSYDLSLHRKKFQKRKDRFIIYFNVGIYKKSILR